MSKLICLLGSDNVGKTHMSKTYTDANWTRIHFASSDYSELLNTSADFVVADRGWIEQSYYDKLYRGIHTTEADICKNIQAFERELAKKYDSVELIMLYSDWNDTMIRRHLDELWTLGVNPCDISSKLEQRKQEHIAYYPHVLRVWNYSMFTREIRTIHG